MKQDWVSILYQLLKKESSTSGKHEASTFYQYFIKKSSLWVMLFQDHLRQQISSCDCPYRLFKELSMGEKEPTEAFLSCRRRSNAVTAQAPRRIHTHISSAGLVTRLNRIESWKAISKIVLLQQKTFVKTSSWLFSFKQFAKCFLSKEGEALSKWDILKLIKELYPGPAHFPGLRQWDMTSLSWSKNLTLVFLASW